MTKTQILQEIFKWNWQTIWHLNQKDVCDDTGILPTNLSKYVDGELEPSMKQMKRIVDSAIKIAKMKYDFMLKVEL